MMFKYEILTVTRNFNHIFFYLFLLHLHFFSSSTYVAKLNNTNAITWYQIYSKLKGAAMPFKKLLINFVFALCVWSGSWKFRFLNIYKFVVIHPGEKYFIKCKSNLLWGNWLPKFQIRMAVPLTTKTPKQCQRHRLTSL